jgi:DNA-binding response OmpR family regulator
LGVTRRFVVGKDEPVESSMAAAPHVLVIDDDEPIRSLLCELLTGEGYRVSANNAWFDDLDLVVRLQPDLLILDIVLGDQWTGLGFLERLKADSRTAPLPIMVCTAASHLTDEIQAQLKAHDCLVIAKPFDLEELLAEVNDCLNKQARIPA